MQLDDLDREGIDDSHVTQSDANDGNDDMKNGNDIDIKQHFFKHGLSLQAYNKIENDINNGDLNYSMLINCHENTLTQIANSYNFTFIQKKTFINAVKILLNG